MGVAGQERREPGQPARIRPVRGPGGGGPAGRGPGTNGEFTAIPTTSASRSVVSPVLVRRGRVDPVRQNGTARGRDRVCTVRPAGRSSRVFWPVRGRPPWVK